MSRRHIPAPPFTPPRAFVDPVDDADAALAVIRLAAQQPLQHETLVLPLDHDSRGGNIIAVSGTDDPDSVLVVVERLCHAFWHGFDVCSIVVATVRPDGETAEHERTRSDGERWWAASRLADAYGIELVEWFVIGPDEVSCPREQTGESERW
jgi:hypothetical protein